MYHIQNMLSPMSPIFAPIQEHLKRLQVDRKNFTHVRELGEGAFGEVTTFFILIQSLGCGFKIGHVIITQFH